MAFELTHEGYFKVPIYAGTNQFTHNGSQGPLAINPDGDLLLRGHSQYDEYKAMSIPTLDGSRATGVGDWVDPCFGAIDDLPTSASGTANWHRGICFPQGQSRAYGTVNKWYNTANSQDFSHYSSDMVSDFRGFWQTTQKRIRTAGSIAELPPSIQTATGHRLMFHECVAQGTGHTNGGPALYTSPLPDAIADEGTISETAWITWYATEGKYHYHNGAVEWDGVSLINGMGGTENNCLWFGRTATLNAYVWYGFQTVEYNGETYTDASSTSKGYHAAEPDGVRGYRPTIFRASWASILAGTPEFEEIDIAEYIDTNNSGLIYGCVDYPNELIYVLEFNCETANRPFVHVFSYTEDEETLPTPVNFNRVGFGGPRIGGKARLGSNRIPAR